MGVWKKSPQVDPALIAQLQQRVDADPTVQRFRSGDGWARVGGGRVSNPNQLSDHVRAILGSSLPDGYDVSNDGEIVYTNKTPALRQATMGALPIASVQALGLIPGVGGSAGSAATAGGVPNMAGAAGLPGGAMYGAAASAPGGAGGIGSALAGGGSMLGKVLTGLKNYLPLGLAGISAFKGLTQGPTDAENRLNDILGIATNRVNASEPLFNELNAAAMNDAGRMRGRLAQADPMFEMLSNMARSQMPRHTREG